MILVVMFEYKVLDDRTVVLPQVICDYMKNNVEETKSILNQMLSPRITPNMNE